MFNTGLMARVSIALSLFLCFADVHGEPMVNLYPGQLHGTTITTRNGRNISAFLGIPYAKPPVGRLRFRTPERIQLEGDIMANVDGNQCPQLNDDGEVVGDEDCLYLNIYTPEISPETAEELRSTMVYFHGGNFERGSGSSVVAGPEYLLDRDIVLVTVNYRLGALGFLSTGDDQAPGNWGLKDQVAALKWVREYIIAFGGNPFQVTIFGQGAGGVSTSLHAISELSTDLFHRYISQSGSGSSVWGFQNKVQNYYEKPIALGKYLKCPTGNSKDLVNCLRKVDVQSIVDSDSIFKRAGDRRWLFTTWAPTEEKGGEGAFLRMFPYLQMLKSGIKDCPAIIGNVRNEGLLITAGFYVNDTKYDAIASNVTAFVRSILTRFYDLNPNKNPNQLIQDYYFKDISPDEDRELLTRNITNLATDMEFRFPAERQTRIVNTKTNSSLYSYTFDYHGTYSKTSETTGNNDDIGVTHGDDTIYLFPIKNHEYELSESDHKMIDIMVDFWTSFARTGTPTSKSADDQDVWQPYDYDTSLSLHIGDNGDPTFMELRPEYDDSVRIWDIGLARQLESYLSLQ